MRRNAMVFQKFALIAVDLALLLALPFSLALGVAGAGEDDDDQRTMQREGIRGRRGRNGYGRDDLRMLGDHDSPRDEVVMFVMQQTRYWRDISDPHINYCLTYGVDIHHGAGIHKLRTKPCDASDEEQLWIIASPSDTHTRIQSKAKSSKCITVLEDERSSANAQLMECGEFEEQRMKLVSLGDASTPDTNGRMIRAIGGFTLKPVRYSCESESHSAAFAPAAKAKWDVVKPEEYSDPPPPIQPSLENAERVLIVSEHDPSKCVSSTLDFQAKDCDKNDGALLWYYFDNNATLWSPLSQSSYTYTRREKGILRGRPHPSTTALNCCLEYTFDGRFDLVGRCAIDFRSGYILAPVEIYQEGSPKKPKNVNEEDLVQLRLLTSNESIDPLCLRLVRYGELILGHCGRYEVDDSEQFFLDGDVDGGVFRIRSKNDLRLCLDVDDLSPRMRPCDDYSDRQYWGYNKKGLSEISNKFWKKPWNAPCLGGRYVDYYHSSPRHVPFLGSCRNMQASEIGWMIIPNDPCSWDEEDRETYQKQDYFLFVSRAEPERCWERDVTDNSGLLLNWRCHMTILRRFRSQIFYFEAVDGSGTSGVRIKYREDDSVCMDVNGSDLSTNIFIDMFKKCESENPNQEWTYNATSGEISTLKRPDLCVSSLCPDRNPDCSDGNECGDFCLQECNGESDQSFDTITTNEYRMMRDYGNGINEDDIVMVVLREDPEYCIKLFDSVELQDVVVSKCKVDNAEEHFAFEQEEKGLRWRSVENPAIFVESVQNNVGKKLICNEGNRNKDKQHWQIGDDGTIRPATKEYLCVTRNACKLASPPEKNENVELIECDADGPKISRQFDFVKPSKYGAYLKKR